jgi:hypothetical protein
VLCMLLAGPLRSIRIETEDLPAAAVREADRFAARFLESAEGAGAKPVARCSDVGRQLLAAASADGELARGVSGWCLKFLFEGRTLQDVARRREAFVQYASEAVHGPLAGLSVADEPAGGLVWSWDCGEVERDAALSHFAAAYGEAFELLTGCVPAAALVVQGFRAYD